MGTPAAAIHSPCRDTGAVTSLLRLDGVSGLDTAKVFLVAHTFKTLAPSCRTQFLWWIQSAKTRATRGKRIAETVQLVAQKKRLGAKE